MRSRKGENGRNMWTHHTGPYSGQFHVQIYIEFRSRFPKAFRKKCILRKEREAALSPRSRRQG